MQHVLKGQGAPTEAPTALGQHYIDTTTGTHYNSVGTASVSDWKAGGGASSTGSGGGLGYTKTLDVKHLTKTQEGLDVLTTPERKLLQGALDYGFITQEELDAQLAALSQQYTDSQNIWDVDLNSGTYHFRANLDPAWSYDYGEKPPITDPTIFCLPVGHLADRQLDPWKYALAKMSWKANVIYNNLGDGNTVFYTTTDGFPFNTYRGGQLGFENKEERVTQMGGLGYSMGLGQLVAITNHGRILNIGDTLDEATVLDFAEVGLSEETRAGFQTVERPNDAKYIHVVSRGTHISGTTAENSCLLVGLDRKAIHITDLYISWTTPPTYTEVPIPDTVLPEGANIYQGVYFSNRFYFLVDARNATSDFPYTLISFNIATNEWVLEETAFTVKPMTIFRHPNPGTLCILHQDGSMHYALNTDGFFATTSGIPGFENAQQEVRIWDDNFTSYLTMEGQIWSSSNGYEWTLKYEVPDQSMPNNRVPRLKDVLGVFKYEDGFYILEVEYNGGLCLFQATPDFSEIILRGQQTIDLTLHNLPPLDNDETLTLRLTTQPHILGGLSTYAIQLGVVDTVENLQSDGLVDQFMLPPWISETDLYRGMVETTPLTSITSPYVQTSGQMGSIAEDHTPYGADFKFLKFDRSQLVEMDIVFHGTYGRMGAFIKPYQSGEVSEYWKNEPMPPQGPPQS